MYLNLEQDLESNLHVHKRITNRLKSKFKSEFIGIGSRFCSFAVKVVCREIPIERHQW